MDNEASTSFNMIMITMNINYRLVPPSNYRANNAETAIRTFKNQICSVDKDLHLQF